NVGPLRKARQRRCQIIRRGSTHMAQILRDDKVGSELFERLRVDGVKTIPTGDIFATEAIDLLRRRAVRNARLNHHALATSLFREIALMADPDHFAVKAQRKQNLRRRWEQRNNPHELTVTRGGTARGDRRSRTWSPVFVLRSFTHRLSNGFRIM